jgi:hypothetical protein
MATNQKDDGMIYNDEFFDMINDGSYKSAKVIVPVVRQTLNKHLSVSDLSVVDWGCGQGAWLRAFKEDGFKVKGFDGEYVDRSRLLIDDAEFGSINFDSLDPVEGKWDLAVSLEVAEHVHPNNADAYVAQVAGSADHLLFSAAIPGQGGVGHLNEQWPDYWVEKFQSHGFKYVSDFIRKLTWDNSDVEPWYKQNILFLSKKDYQLPQGWNSVVHPIVWNHIRGAG